VPAVATVLDNVQIVNPDPLHFVENIGNAVAGFRNAVVIAEGLRVLLVSVQQSDDVGRRPGGILLKSPD
jgi:hypothetical protein